MSILNSNIPNQPTSPIKFIVGLEPYLKLLKECHSDTMPKHKKGKTVEEKTSVASHSVEIMNKYLNDPSNAAILQQMLALLMQVWSPHRLVIVYENLICCTQILADPQFDATLLEEVIKIPAVSLQEKVG